MKTIRFTTVICAMLGFINSQAQQSDYDSLYLVRNCVVLDAKESVQDERVDLIYKWNFGDGSEGYGEVVEHCYDTLGKYDVILSIVDPEVLLIFQEEWPFEVTITEDFNLSFNVKIQDSRVIPVPRLNYSEKPGKVSYFWDYGDGSFEIGEKTTHLYDSTGEYVIRLLAEVESKGEILSLSQTKLIKIN